MKAIFTPFSVALGLLAGQVSRRIFDRVWKAIADEEAPKSKHREISLGQLAVALVVEGAIQRLVKGLFDHGSRQGFLRLTGSWPGEERPEPEE
jgi:hypothetical protein